MTRQKSRMAALVLLQEAGNVLLQMDDKTTRIDHIISEINLCWKHVRDMDVGDQEEAP